LGFRSDIEKGLAYFVIPGLDGHLVWDGSPFSYQEVEMRLSSLLIEKVNKSTSFLSSFKLVRIPLILSSAKKQSTTWWFIWVMGMG
jgi:hypothetical protein